MRRLCRETDWSETPLGPVASWSETLRGVVRACLESPFPINLWCGPELVLVYNDAYRHVLGSKHPGALGRPGSEVWGEIWPEIAPMFDSIRAGGPPTYAEDAPFAVQRAGLSLPEPGAGEPNAWFTFSLSAVRDADGEVVAYLNIVSETTGRVLAQRALEAARVEAERAEARLREVFAQAPAFMAVLRGERHVFEYVNEAYYQLVGHRRLLGRPVFQALPEVRGQGLEDLLSSVLESGEPFVGREFPVLVSRTPDSEPEERFLDFVYYPITEADGTRSGVVAHGSDVTEHVLARREAQRARAEAEHANQAKSHFLANMSHEIRTPINAVIGYADLLDAEVAGPLSGRQEEYVGRIRASSQHLLSLVNDVLDLAKVEAGEMSVASRETEVDEVVTAALQIVAPQAEARGLTVREETEPGVATRFLGDEDRTRQILLNLLSNAFKFTAPGGTVTVRRRMAEARDPDAGLLHAGPWLVLEVEDTGIGIPAERLESVFEPFVQAETGHTRLTGGTGLGLTISRRFARLMSGALTVRSEVGVGSCFALWLPPAGGAPAVSPTARLPRARAWPSAPRELPGLGALGRLILSSTERLEEELVERLKADRSIRAAERLGRSRLADHTAALLSVMGRTVTALDEAGDAAMLLRDGEDFRTLLSARHARQRRRLGWTRAELQREYEILHETLDAFLRRVAPTRTTSEIEAALGVVHRLLDYAEAAGLAAFDAGPEEPAAP